MTINSKYYIPSVDHNAHARTHHGRNAHLSNTRYDYNSPGMMEMAYRVPDNMIGSTLRSANKATSMINMEMMKDQIH